MSAAIAKARLLAILPRDRAGGQWIQRDLFRVELDPGVRFVSFFRWKWHA